MLPVLFSIGKIPVSSYGVFLAFGFIVGVFLIWRLSRAWDLEEESILDFTLLTFLGGLVGARIYYVIENIRFFVPFIFRIVLINKYPGFSFWGAILGGWLTISYLARSRKVDFWQIADIASIGFLGSLVLADLGCFLGGCDIGIKSNLFFSVKMVGILGNRFPTQVLEAILLLWALLNVWSKATHFHPSGKIVSLTLIYIGLIKFSLEPLRQYHNEGVFLSLVLIALGVTILYKVIRRRLISDLRLLARLFIGFFISKDIRNYLLDRFKKYWYNQKTVISWRFRNFKKLLRRFNVKFS